MVGKGLGGEGRTTLIFSWSHVATGEMSANNAMTMPITIRLAGNRAVFLFPNNDERLRFVRFLSLISFDI